MRRAVFDLWFSPQCCCGFVSVSSMTEVQGRNVLLSQKSFHAVRHLRKPPIPASHFLCLRRVASFTCRALLSDAVALFSPFKRPSFFLNVVEEKTFTNNVFFWSSFCFMYVTQGRNVFAKYCARLFVTFSNMLLYAFFEALQQTQSPGVASFHPFDLHVPLRILQPQAAGSNFARPPCLHDKGWLLATFQAIIFVMACGANSKRRAQRRESGKTLPPTPTSPADSDDDDDLRMARADRSVHTAKDAGCRVPSSLKCHGNCICNRFLE